MNARPSFHKIPSPKFKRPQGRRDVTVCIAALCESNGESTKVVCAVDGKLSHNVTADVDAPKIIFLGDIVFMFAGTLSNADLILDEIKQRPRTDQLKPIVRAAYRSRLAQWSADRFLMQYDMDMQEFKKEGRKIFGDERYSELSRTIEQDVANYNEQVLVVGWKKDEIFPEIFSIGRDGMSSHVMDGIAAIGSGADVAMSTMLLLKQNRHKTLEETIYAVAAAKFAAEKCEGVGELTTMYVSWKKGDDSPKHHPNGCIVQRRQIAEIRKVWDRHGEPKIPNSALRATGKIVDDMWQKQSRKVTVRHIDMKMRSLRGTKPLVSQTEELKS